MLVRWECLLEEIRPYYPKAGRGRGPYGLESMLRVHCVQLFYNLSDPATEDMLYEIERVRRLTGINLKKVLDETTILNFRMVLFHLGPGMDFKHFRLYGVEQEFRHCFAGVQQICGLDAVTPAALLHCDRG